MWESREEVWFLLPNWQVLWRFIIMSALDFSLMLSTPKMAHHIISSKSLIIVPIGGTLKLIKPGLLIWCFLSLRTPIEPCSYGRDIFFHIDFFRNHSGKFGGEWMKWSYLLLRSSPLHTGWGGVVAIPVFRGHWLPFSFGDLKALKDSFDIAEDSSSLPYLWSILIHVRF